MGTNEAAATNEEEEVSSQETAAEQDTPTTSEDEGGSELNYGEMFTSLANDEESGDSDQAQTTETESKETAEQTTEKKGDEATAETETKTEEKEAEAEPGKEEAKKPDETSQSQEQTTQEQKAPTTKAEEEQQVESAEFNVQKYVEEMEARREEGITKLADDYYSKAFPDELWAELEEDPRKAVPKMLAHVYMDAVQGVTAGLLQQLPTVIENVQQAKEQDQKAESLLFDKFPDLKEPEFKEEIAPIARSYAQQFPNDTLEQRINRVGLHLYLSHNRTPPGYNQQQQESQQQATAQTPHKPVTTSSGGGTPDNPFEALAEEILDSD